MTEDFKKWVDEVSEGKFPGSYENAWFWTREVFKEIEDRQTFYKDEGEVLLELRREWFGTSNRFTSSK